MSWHLGPGPVSGAGRVCRVSAHTGPQRGPPCRPALHVHPVSSGLMTTGSLVSFKSPKVAQTVPAGAIGHELGGMDLTVERNFKGASAVILKRKGVILSLPGTTYRAECGEGYEVRRIHDRSFLPPDRGMGHCGEEASGRPLGPCKCLWLNHW